MFRLAAHQQVPVHTGQAWRANVHLCLLHCEHAKIIVADVAQEYTAGELLAFDDASLHTVRNAGGHDRILLAVGVFHPNIGSMHGACPV